MDRIRAISPSRARWAILGCAFICCGGCAPPSIGGHAVTEGLGSIVGRWEDSHWPLEWSELRIHQDGSIEFTSEGCLGKNSSKHAGVLLGMELHVSPELGTHSHSRIGILVYLEARGYKFLIPQQDFARWRGDLQDMKHLELTEGF